MTGVDFKVLRSEVSIAQVLELLQFVPCERRGDQVRGVCPLHDASSQVSRSFSANFGKNAYRCFKCGAAGNQLDLWAAATKLPLHQAAISLCAKLGLSVPILEHSNATPLSANDSGSVKRNP